MESAENGRKSITVEGTLGVGKTTAIKGLPGAVRHLEVFPRSLLSSMYDGPGAFAFQAWMTGHRATVNGYIRATPNRLHVRDRGLFGDAVFAAAQFICGELKADQVRALAADRPDAHPRGDRIVLLYVPPDVAIERLRQRNRSGEACVSPEYMTLVDSLYLELLLRTLVCRPEADIVVADWARFGALADYVAAPRREHDVSVVAESDDPDAIHWRPHITGGDRVVPMWFRQTPKTCRRVWQRLVLGLSVTIVSPVLAAAIEAGRWTPAAFGQLL